MRSIAAEKGLVKLVHPGRYVEVLKEPTTAAEVMRKNPRHCVTRPDIFKFPWIVIKPEAVLPPGKIFYVVPEHTIYCLMKSEKHRSRNALDQQPFPHNANAGLTPKHQSYRGTSERVMSSQRSGFSDVEDRSGEGSFVTPWLDRRFHNTYIEFRRHFLSEDKEFPERNPGVAISGGIADHRASMSRYHHHHRQRDRIEALPLKSCLKKPDSDRKSLGLRVRFVLTNKERESRKNVRLIRI